jgi:serine phosphatase RsbU (regulator of sigma subunit)
LRVELETARQVQEQLVAPDKDVLGFRIESAYAPAKQVCGDFFRIRPEQDGSVLVVVGDVSRKGLKAAITVSVIMGALHDYSSSRPAEVLTHLNRVLHGRVSGFVTCSATLIASDGTMHLANAGNPAPYRNGEEMTVEPGLPLGVIAELTTWRHAIRSLPATGSHLSPLASLKRPTRKESSTALSGLRPSAAIQPGPSRKQPPGLARRMTLQSCP